jgi:hypothetical protein
MLHCGDSELFPGRRGWRDAVHPLKNARFVEKARIQGIICASVRHFTLTV